MKKQNIISKSTKRKAYHDETLNNKAKATKIEALSEANLSDNANTDYANQKQKSRSLTFKNIKSNQNSNQRKMKSFFPTCKKSQGNLLNLNNASLSAENLKLSSNQNRKDLTKHVPEVPNLAKSSQENIFKTSSNTKLYLL